MTEEVHRMLRDWHEVAGLKFEGDWLRVMWRSWDARVAWLKTFAERGFATHEGDVNPVLRHLVDRGVTIARPRSAYIDIETDSRVPFSRKEEMRVLCWSLVDCDTGATTSALLRADTNRHERDLLAQLWEALAPYDRGLAWNGDRFDFPVLRARMLLHRLPVEWREKLWLDHLETFRRMNTMAAESGEEKQSYALDSIARALGVGKKHDFDARQTWQAWATGGDCDADCRQCRGCLRRYCENDTRLMRAVEQKTGYVELLQTLAEACGTFADSRGTNPSVQVESFLQRLGHANGHKYETAKRVPERAGKFKGAYVMPPRRSGIVKNVHVCDFASMYPSIIVSWNMSPETKLPRELPGLAQLRHSTSPLTDVHFNVVTEGMLPKAVAELMRLRKQWSAAQAAAAPGTPEWLAAGRWTTSYKIAANGFFGVVGMVVGRFFDREIAEAITQCGVWLIRCTIEEAERAGFEVIYADTDSAFVVGCTEEEFRHFVAWCNAELYPRLLRSVGCRENKIVLAYEKAFERLVLFGKMKRYVARWEHYKGKRASSDSKPEVKGLEYKRGDSLRAARALQQEVVDLLVGKMSESPPDYEAALDRHLDRFMNGVLTVDDVAMSKRLNRELRGYVTRVKLDGTNARQLPHIEIAREMEARGEDVGEGAKIDYVKVDAAAKPVRCVAAAEWDGMLDRAALWDADVMPPTLRVLAAAFPAHDWTRWARVRAKPVRRARAPKGAPGGTPLTPAP